MATINQILETNSIREIVELMRQLVGKRVRDISTNEKYTIVGITDMVNCTVDLSGTNEEVEGAWIGNLKEEK